MAEEAKIPEEEKKETVLERMREFMARRRTEPAPARYTESERIAKEEEEARKRMAKEHKYEAFKARIGAPKPKSLKPLPGEAYKTMEERAAETRAKMEKLKEAQEKAKIEKEKVEKFDIAHNYIRFLKPVKEEKEAKSETTLDIKPDETDYKEIKEHYKNLDEYSQHFLNKYLPADTELYSLAIGPDTVLKIQDKKFYDFLIEKVNGDMSNIHDLRRYRNKIFDNKFGNKDDMEFQLAQIIENYAKSGFSDRLSSLLNYDLNDKNIKPEDIDKVYNLEKIHSFAPDKFAKGLLEADKGELSKEAKEVLHGVIKDMELIDKQFKFGVITVEEYNSEMQDIGKKLEKMKLDENLSKELTDRMNKFLNVKNTIEMNRLYDYINKIKHIIAQKPNNSVAINLAKFIEEIENEIKNGSIDIQEAYRRMDVLSPIKESKLEDIELEKDETGKQQGFKLDEEILPMADSEKRYPDIDKVYKTIDKSNLVGNRGISLSAHSPIVIGETIYNLQGKQLEDLNETFERIFDKYKIQKKGADKIPIENIKKMIDDLEDRGVKLLPEHFKILNEASPSKKSKKDLIGELVDYHQHVIDLMNLSTAAHEKMEKEIKDEKEKIINSRSSKINETETLLDEAKTTEDKEKYQKEINKLNKDLSAELQKAENDIRGVYTKMVINKNDEIRKDIARYAKRIASVKKISRPIPVLKLKNVKVNIQPKIIIPANRLKEYSAKIASFANQSIYATKSLTHEPQKGKIYHRSGRIEYLINTKDDLKNMLSEIMNKDGDLYIIDLRNGRLFPIEPKEAFEGAVYLFRKRRKSLETGGALKSFSPHTLMIPKETLKMAIYPKSQKKRESLDKFKYYENKEPSMSVRAWYPALDQVITEEEDLLPYKFMRHGYDKIPQMMHKLHKRRGYDYRDQHRALKGGSIWKSIKNGIRNISSVSAYATPGVNLFYAVPGVHQQMDKFGNYVLNKAESEGKVLGNQTVYEGKNFVNQEKKAAKNIYEVNKKFYSNPSLKTFGNASLGTLNSSARMAFQPTISTAREISNVSDFAGNVPGLNVAKFGLEYALPPLAVLDASSHAIKNIDDGNYLKAGINALDAAIGTGSLSGNAELGTKLMKTGLGIADTLSNN